MHNTWTCWPPGITADSSLSFVQQACEVVNKAKSVFFLIRRSIGYNSSSRLSLQLYKTLTRSILEYGSTVWSPYQHSYINILESVQRVMTRYIWHYPKSSYETICIKLNLLPLLHRHEVSDLLFMLKCVNRLCDVGISKYVCFKQQNTALRSGGRGPLLRPSMCKAETFKNFFFFLTEL